MQHACLEHFVAYYRPVLVETMLIFAPYGADCRLVAESVKNKIHPSDVFTYKGVTSFQVAFSYSKIKSNA
uniref:Uncharacterized protein n=1 Tax=Ascaris lumbricoides TaxID=6252 RepID=A0A0M3IQN1_ASCLU